MGIGDIGRRVSIGVIGLGARSKSQIDLLLSMQDVRIQAVCDVYADRVTAAQETICKQYGEKPAGETDYRAVLSRTDIEAVLIFTSWQNHLSIAIEALWAGKIVGLEVGGASSVEECWNLVRTSEETGLPVMLLENCCYGREEMTVLNMVRKGVFGELVHCQGGYQHDLRDEVGLGDINRHYRQDNFMHRNGELYPTHELGPIAKYLNLNHGNRMLTLVSMASKAVGEAAWLADNRPNDPVAKATFNEGDIVSTLIKCAGGETILLTHDCTLPRAYSRGGRVQGTKGLWMEDNRSVFIEGRSPSGDSWAHKWESDAAYMEEYLHPLWKAYEAHGLMAGHDGLDFLVLRAFFESIQQNKPFPIDVYDTAAWMAVTALSEASIAQGSMPVSVPDFTNGRWIEKRPVHTGQYALDD